MYAGGVLVAVGLAAAAGSALGAKTTEVGTVHATRAFAVVVHPVKSPKAGATAKGKTGRNGSSVAAPKRNHTPAAPTASSGPVFEQGCDGTECTIYPNDTAGFPAPAQQPFVPAAPSQPQSGPNDCTNENC